MSEIHKNSILLNYQGPLWQAATNPNSVVIAGGSASIPTGRPAPVESNECATPLYDGVGVDSTRTPETMWPTGPGIQIVSAVQETEECCECCCEEPEPPLAFFKLAEDCNCPVDKTKPFELANLGIFLDGWDGNDKFSGEGKEGSIISYLCKRYTGRSFYALGPHFPGGPIPRPPGVEEGAVEFADRIARNIREYVCWLTETIGEAPDLGLRPCVKMNIDIFGFSRGGYVAARIVEKLAEPLTCKKCDASFIMLDGVPVRFLALIEPARQFPLNLPGFRADQIPKNVEVSWLANGANSRINYHVHNSDAREKLGHGKNKQPDYMLGHGEMGDATKRDSDGRSPREDLWRFYNDSMDSFSGSPRFEVKEIAGKIGDCGGPLRK